MGLEFPRLGAVTLIARTASVTGLPYPTSTLRDNPAVQAGAAQRARLLTTAKTPAEYAATFARMVGTAADSADKATASAAVGTDPAEAGRMGCALLQARMAP